ncbi:MAG: hypothetical protein JW837_12715 [Sedimentisphaerales bacterium]|nr:hypothetical protein [Sedimentisphaerales bacterium]
MCCEIRTFKLTIQVITLLLLMSNQLVYAETKPRVSLSANGGFIVDGKPFFPIWAWAQPSHLIGIHKDLGMNTLHPGMSDKSDPVNIYLDKAYAQGMMVVLPAEQCSKAKGHPAVLMYMVGHEDDIAVNYYSLEIDETLPAIWLEGEWPKVSTFASNTWLNSGEPIDLLSNGRWLTAVQNGHWTATYEFTVIEPGVYKLWAREFIKDWANPTTWRIDDKQWQTTSRTLSSTENMGFSNNRAVGWCFYGQTDLSAGVHSFQIQVAPGRTGGKKDKVTDTVIAGYDGFLFTMADTPPRGKKGVLQPKRHPRHQRALYSEVKQCDPDAQTFAIFSGGFFDRYRKLDLRWYREYMSCTDVTGFCYYPVTGHNKPELVPEVGLATKLLTQMARPNQPVITFIESSDQELSWTYEGFRPPMPEEMRSEAFQAVANGAKGIGHFTISFGRGKKFKWINLTEPMKQELRRTNKQLTRLAAPIVLGEDISKKLIVNADKTYEKYANGHAIQVIGKYYEGKTYIIAVNVTRKTVLPTFKIAPAIKAKEAVVFDENRTVPLENSGFSDTFAPLEVHIYTIDSPVNK